MCLVFAHFNTTMQSLWNSYTKHALSVVLSFLHWILCTLNVEKSGRMTKRSRYWETFYVVLLGHCGTFPIQINTKDCKDKVGMETNWTKFAGIS